MKKDELTQKWLNNKLSPDEQKAFLEMEESAFFKEIIDEGKRFKITNINKVSSFSDVEKRLDEKDTLKMNNWFRFAASIAAVFVLGLSVFYFFDKNSLKTFDTQFSQKEEIILPDNSIVTLNKTSKLSYNTSKWKTKKSLTLKGEAFFDVTKGKRFDVETLQGKVSVLGTEFNVVARDSIFKVICYEGLVEVAYNEQLIKLPAGNGFKVVNGKTEKYAVVVAKPTWLNNMSVFNQAKITEVLDVLSRQYDVSIDYSAIDDKILFTGAFEHNNLENSLIATLKTLNLTYKISKNKVVVINAKK